MAKSSDHLELLKDYRSQTENLTAEEIVRWAVKTFGVEGLTLASSLGGEDQVLTDLVMSVDRRVPVFTLDTGRHFPETYETLRRTSLHFGFNYHVYFPDRQEVEDLVRQEGPDLFYLSVENRKACCGVRKVHPLGRALTGRGAWLVGLRRDQALTRAHVNAVDWDSENGLFRVAPLYNWSEAAVWEHIRGRAVPFHPLQERGFRSMGCAPCTRAVQPGEDVRAGRWWWEDTNARECGLHSKGHR